MSTDDLNIFQQVYVQTFGANLVGTLVGTEAILQDVLNYSLDSLINRKLKRYGWEITWGPRVWKEKPLDIFSGPDNVWFASFAPNVKYPDGVTIDTCVVAIAGTAIFSEYGWIIEDFGVDKVVDFDSWIKDWQPGSVPQPQAVQNPPLNAPYAAFGTSSGVYQLMVHASPSKRPSEGKKLIEYLQTLPPKCRVIFTGHSLGGALSPTLPLGLEGAGLLNQIQDPTKNILTLPAAGATPGEKLLSKAYSQIFPQPESGGYQVWNADFFNTLDIVPQAWCTKPEESTERNMKKIVTIYGTLSDHLASKIEALVAKESAAADKSGITYIPIRGNAFTGTPPSKPPSNLIQFILEAIKQHTKAYHDKVKVNAIMADFYRQLVGFEGVEKQTLAQAARRYPILRFAVDDLPEGIENIYPYDVILENEE